MKQAKVLTDKEFKRLLKVIATTRHATRNRLAVMLSHYAGLRVGEIAHLKIRDVQGPANKVLDRVHLNPSYTKGGCSRTILLNSTLIKEIEQYLRYLSALSGHLSAQRVHRLLSPDAPLIASQKRGHFSANSLCQLFGELYEMAGIVGASSHSGRRGFISKLAHSGVSPKVIMELAGHRQLTTTQRYIEVTDELKREAVELL